MDQGVNTLKALVYIARDTSNGAPRGGYLEKIIQAAQKNHFDSDYISSLNGWFSNELQLVEVKYEK